MLVGLHSIKSGKNDQSCEIYRQILDHNRIENILVHIDDKDFWEKLRMLDLFIFPFHNTTDLKTMAATLLPIIQDQLKIKCFPNTNTCWHYDDKIKQYYLLKELGYPVVDTFIFWDKENAMEWIKSAAFPLVFKLKTGSKSSAVLFIKDAKQARKITARMFGKGLNPYKMPFIGSVREKDLNLTGILKETAQKIYRIARGIDIHPYWDIQKNYVLFQKFLPNNEFDTRVSVIGKRAFVGRRYNRQGDFRASGSGRVELENLKPDRRFLKIAFEISEKMNYQCMAYDFLYDENHNPAICEISYTFPPEPVFGPNGYWDPEDNWHPGHFWPHYCQLVDLLEMPALKQPEIMIPAEKSLVQKVSEKLNQNSLERKVN